MRSTFKSLVRSVAALSLVVAPIALVTAPREARADMGPKIDKGLFLPVGLNLGYSVNTAKGAANGFLFGGEASLVFLKQWIWTGTYADVLRDFGEDETRTSIGLEAGVGPFGVDFGYLGAFRGEVAHGFRGRAIVTLPPLGVYAGYSRTWTDHRTHLEFGALFKIPVPIFTESVKRPEPVRETKPEEKKPEAPVEPTAPAPASEPAPAPAPDAEPKPAPAPAPAP